MPAEVPEHLLAANPPQPDERRFWPAPEPTTYEVNLRQLTYCTVSLLLTLMTFPRESADPGAIEQLRLSMATAMLNGLARSGSAETLEPMPVRLADLSAAPKDADTVWRRFCSALVKRMSAGRMGIAALGLASKLPAGVTGTSITQLTKMALQDVGLSDVKNAKQRVWRDILTVLPLCVAIAMYMHQVNRGRRAASAPNNSRTC